MRWAEVWRQRSAVVYTVGSWIVFGSVAYYTTRYTMKREEEEPPPPPPPPTGVSVSEDGQRETLAYSTQGSGFNVVSVMIYKSKVVSRTTRLRNYVHSFLDDSGDKGK